MRSHTLTIDESQRQMLLMALAHLAVERPGWDWALSQVAAKVDNRRGDGRPEMFEEFRTMHGGDPPTYPAEGETEATG